MKKYLVEFMGTYFFVLATGITGDAIAIGFTLSAMIYIGAIISGAHYNPAVSIAAFILKKINAAELGGYIVSQIFGAFLAASTILILAKLPFYVEPPVNSTFYQQLTMESLMTFALVLLALVSWIGNPSNKSVATYSFIMGFGMVAFILTSGNLSGAVFNPALSMGTAFIDYLLGGGSYKDVPTYTIAPIFGASLAAFAYKYLIQDSD